MTPKSPQAAKTGSFRKLKKGAQVGTAGVKKAKSGSEAAKSCNTIIQKAKNESHAVTYIRRQEAKKGSGEKSYLQHNSIVTINHKYI